MTREGNNVNYVYPMDEELFEEVNKGFKDYDEFTEYIEDGGLDVSNFYISIVSSFREIVYFEDDYIYVSILGGTLSKEILKMYDLFNRVKYFRELHESVQKGEEKITILYYLIDKRILVSYFLNHWKEIPQDLQLEIFNDVYTTLEYNHQLLFEPEIVDTILKSQGSKVAEKLLSMKDSIKIHDNKVTIYRGEASKSTSYTDGITSWTLDFKVAEFFANRFQTEVNNIYRAKIDINKILHLVSNLETQEKEILVDVADLEDIELM